MGEIVCAGTPVSLLMADRLIAAASFLCALTIGLLSGAVGFLGGSMVLKEGALCAVMGSFAGIGMGGAVTRTLGCGAKTILVCWKDQPNPLRQSSKLRALLAEFSSTETATL